MGIKTDPGNPNIHYIDCRPDGYKGRRVREEFHGTRDAAEAYYRALMRQPISKPQLPKALTIKALWPEYIRHCAMEKSKTTLVDLQSCWNRHLAGFFGQLQPKNITKQLIEAYKKKRLSETRWGREGERAPKPRTINKELAYLSSFLAWAAEFDHCDPLPFRIAKFSRKVTRAPKARPLSPGQVTAIFEEIEPKYQLVYLLMVDAGLRASEALALKREHVELERGLIYVFGKGNKERIVPIITSRLRKLLEERAAVDGYLTVNPATKRPYTSIKKALSRAAAKAGVEKHVYQHLLRHSFGTTAAIAGMSMAAVQDIMGHADPETTKVYQNLAAKYLQEQGLKFGKLVENSDPHGQLDNSR